MDPANAPTDAAMGFTLASVGRWKEAIPYAQQGEDSEPSSRGLAALLTTLLEFGPNPRDAEDIMDRARQRFPNIPFVAGSEFGLSHRGDRDTRSPR